MNLINPERFSDEVYQALKAAFSGIRASNSDQLFYTFALFTDDSLQFLHPAANTEEGLAATVRRYKETVDPEYGCTSTQAGMRWSYGDWKFFPDVGGGHFDEINRILASQFDWRIKSQIGEEESMQQIQLLWGAALSAFRRLDLEGFFGTGPIRSRLTLMFVGHLPQEVFNHCLSRLNPPEVVEQFLNWNYEASDAD